MEPVALFSLQGVLALLAASGIGAWIGHTIGHNNEARRKGVALAEADAMAKETVAALEAENQKKIDVLNKANSNQLEGLKQTHSQQIEQINSSHREVIDSLKSGYASEMERLNASNHANLSEMEQRREKALDQVRDEHRAAVEALRKDHGSALEQLTRDRDERLREAEQRSSEQKRHFEVLLAETRTERDALRSRASELEADLAELRDEVKEAKLNNMFSVSKSGEKLIRVVRSVQELASELDETSRTVTGGDYSFFEQIKDQRDRDTVLGLTAAGRTYSHAGPAGAAEPGSVADADADDGNEETPRQD